MAVSIGKEKATIVATLNIESQQTFLCLLSLGGESTLLDLHNKTKVLLQNTIDFERSVACLERTGVVRIQKSDSSIISLRKNNQNKTKVFQDQSAKSKNRDELESSRSNREEETLPGTRERELNNTRITSMNNSKREIDCNSIENGSVSLSYGKKNITRNFASQNNHTEETAEDFTQRFNESCDESSDQSKPVQKTLPGFSQPKKRKKLTASQEQFEKTKKLVELWINRSGRSEDLAVVTPYRIKLVKERTAEGYSFEHMAKAIAGICYSQWHKEKGIDTFEMALGSGRIDKSIGVWERCAPLERVLLSIEHTGRVPESRRQEVEQYFRDRDRDKRTLEQDKKTKKKARELAEQRARETQARQDDLSDWSEIFSEGDGESNAQRAGEIH